MSTALEFNSDQSLKSTDVNFLQPAMATKKTLLAEKTPVEFKNAPVDRSRYVVFLMHLTEDMIHHTAKVLIERMLDGLLADGLNPAGIMRNGDTIEVSFKDPTTETLKKMGSRAFTQNGVPVYYLRDNESMLIVNIRGNDFRHPIVDACGLVQMYGKIVHCYRQIHEYRRHRFENGIISVWMKDIHTVIPTKFDKRRSCFFNKEKSKIMLTQEATRAAAVEIVRANPPVKAVVKPSAETGGAVAKSAASVEPSVSRQVMVEETVVAASAEPVETRPSVVVTVVPAAAPATGAASVAAAPPRRPVLAEKVEVAASADRTWVLYPLSKGDIDDEAKEWYLQQSTECKKRFLRLFTDLQGQCSGISWMDVKEEWNRRESPARKQAEAFRSCIQSVFGLADKESDAAAGGAPSADESQPSDGGHHHQCGICSKKFHSLAHLKTHALLRHADDASEEEMEGIGDIRPGVEKTPESDDNEGMTTLGAADLRAIKKQEMQKRHADKRGVKVKKKAAQPKKQ